VATNKAKSSPKSGARRRRARRFPTGCIALSVYWSDAGWEARGVCASQSERVTGLVRGAESDCLCIEHIGVLWSQVRHKPMVRACRYGRSDRRITAADCESAQQTR
jgi:hypothetical protein